MPEPNAQPRGGVDASMDASAAVHPVAPLAALAKKVRPRQVGLIPGNGDKVGFWLTPPHIYKLLDDEFHFDFDACPYPRPAGWDGLKEEWGGSSVYVNPPFVGPEAKPTAWARKCRAEAARGKRVVLIFPEDRWVIDLLRAGAVPVPMPDFEWLDTRGRPAKNGRGHIAWVLRGKAP